MEYSQLVKGFPKEPTFPELPIDLLRAIVLSHKTNDHPEYTIGNVDFNVFKGYWGTAVSFQGTQGSADLFDDLQIWKTDWYGHRVHDGFAEQAQQVKEFMDQLDYDVLIGHSLGGAIAQLYAWRDKKPAVTFGSPRVGDRKFAKAVTPYVVRVHSRGDKIAYLPPWWLNYRHSSGRVIRVGKNDHQWWELWKFFYNNNHWTEDYLEGIKDYFDL